MTTLRSVLSQLIPVWSGTLFNLVYDLDYIDSDCFAQKQPIVVPAATFLSQLI